MLVATGDRIGEPDAPNTDAVVGKTSQIVLSANDLAKRFVLSRTMLGQPRRTFDAVRGVHFTICKGETLALVGESGAGKSTVGRMVLRLTEPDRGEVVFDGIDVLALHRVQLRRLRKRMQMIFQDPFGSLDPRLSIGDSVAEPVLLHTGLKAAESRRRVGELLDRVGISRANVDRYPQEFSGGQLQRIAIARALATEPDIIVCDEPVAALDVSVRAQIINLLQDLQDERGVSYLFISHDLSLVRHMAHRIAVMREGLIVEAATPAELFDHPREDYTRQLIDAVPVADPRLRRRHVSEGRGA